MVTGDDGGPAPFRGVTGIMPSARRRHPFVKRQVEAVSNAPDADFSPGIDTWVTMPAGFAVGSQGALSIIQNYATVANCGED